MASAKKRAPKRVAKKRTRYRQVKTVQVPTTTASRPPNNKEITAMSKDDLWDRLQTARGGLYKALMAEYRRKKDAPDPRTVSDADLAKMDDQEVAHLLSTTKGEDYKAAMAEFTRRKGTPSLGTRTVSDEEITAAPDAKALGRMLPGLKGADYKAVLAAYQARKAAEEAEWSA